MKTKATNGKKSSDGRRERERKRKFIGGKRENISKAHDEGCCSSDIWWIHVEIHHGSQEETQGIIRSQNCLATPNTTHHKHTQKNVRFFLKSK